MNTYKYTNIKPIIDPETTLVEEWLFEITGSDGGSKTAVHSLKVVPGKPFKAVSEWTKKEIDAVCAKCDADLKKQVDSMIASQKTLEVDKDFDYSSL